MCPVISLGPVSIPTYGLFVAAGYLAAIAWLKARLPALGLSEDHFWSLIYWIFAGALIGGKLLYFAVAPEPPSLSLQSLRYGFVFFGGFLGSTAMAVLKWRSLRFDFWKVADHCGAALALGHAVGRLGCLAAGCCYGRPSGLPWAFPLGGHPASITPRELWDVPLHPAQLYEAAANLLIFLYLARRLRAGPQNGRLFALYVGLYSAARFCVEFFRADERGFLGPLSTSQVLALALGAAAAGLWRMRSPR